MPAGGGRRRGRVPRVGGGGRRGAARAAAAGAGRAQREALRGRAPHAARAPRQLTARARGTRPARLAAVNNPAHLINTTCQKTKPAESNADQ